jgi:hypothetical protein
MELLDQVHVASQVSPGAPLVVTPDEERAARRSLREQIAKLERELADAFVTTYQMGGPAQAAGASGAARLLDLGELERVRDRLAAKLAATRAMISELADQQAQNRLCLERMLLEPGKYRFTRISMSDIGEPGCGAWEVRPRLGLIGMLMGWWQVKLSSGCPLARGRAFGCGPLQAAG